MLATPSLVGDRTSSVKRTCPGIVFVLPGLRVRIPVETRAGHAVARRWECVMRRAVRSIASARLWRGVVPVCASGNGGLQLVSTHESSTPLFLKRGMEEGCVGTSSVNVNSKPLVSLDPLYDTDLLLLRL